MITPTLFETYATLLNRKIVLPSSTSNYVAIDRDYWIASLAARLAEVDLDPAWYADSNAFRPPIPISNRPSF